MKFKIGDWVRVVGQKDIEIVNNKNVSIFNNPKKSIFFKHWQPKQGEWCLFYFSESVSDHNCLTLGKFIGFRNKESNALFLEYYDTDNNIFASDMCEPFIGNLPSFIKE